MSLLTVSPLVKMSQLTVSLLVKIKFLCNTFLLVLLLRELRSCQGLGHGCQELWVSETTIWRTMTKTKNYKIYKDKSRKNSKQGEVATNDMLGVKPLRVFLGWTAGNYLALNTESRVFWRKPGETEKMWWFVWICLFIFHFLPVVKIIENHHNSIQRFYYKN